MVGCCNHISVIVIFLMNNLWLRHCHCNPVVRVSSESENTTTTFCPGGEDWCDNPDHYPQDGILEALSQEESQLLELLDNRDHIIVQRDVQIENSSVHIFQDHSNICQSTYETHYIRAARNINNEYQYIINIGGPGANQTFTQTIPMTICSSPWLACGHGDLVEVETLCQQEYREIKLLIFTRDRRISLDTFAFKSCCVCFIKNDLIFK